MIQFMFLLKKLLAAWALPPGLFVILLLIGAVYSRRHKTHMAFLIVMAMGVYLASIAPVANSLLLPLENHYTIPASDDLRGAHAYVVLAGGANDKGVDIFGRGTLSGDSTARLAAAYRLYRIARRPIIISGGPATPSGIPEAEIGKRFLVKLGVRSDHIMIEIRSRDTQENAIYTKELCAGKGISKIVLITSAYHMKRAMILFTPIFRDVIPCPSDFKASRDQQGIRDFFPSVESFHGTSIALHERLGILVTKIKLWRKSPTNMEARSWENETSGRYEGRSKPVLLINRKRVASLYCLPGAWSRS